MGKRFCLFVCLSEKIGDQLRTNHNNPDEDAGKWKQGFKKKKEQARFP